MLNQTKRYQEQSDTKEFRIPQIMVRLKMYDKLLSLFHHWSAAIDTCIRIIRMKTGGENIWKSNLIIIFTMNTPISEVKIWLKENQTQYNQPRIFYQL